MRIGNRIIKWLQANKKLLTILFAALLIFTSEVWQYRIARRNTLNNVERNTMQQLNVVNQVIRDRLSVFEMAADGISWGIEDNTDIPDSIPGYLVQLMKSCSDITSCAVCFVPYFYPSKGKLYEPVALRDQSGIIRTTQIAGPEHDYTTMPFYKYALERDSDYWSEPYINGADQKLVVSYSLVLHDNHRNAFGVLTIDVSLDWLNDLANQAYPPPSSFVAILSHEGEVVTCPKDKREYLFSLFQAEDKLHSAELKQLAQKLSQKTKGMMAVAADNGGKDLLFFEKIESEVNWIITVIGSEEEIFHSQYLSMRRRLLITFATLTLLGFIIWYSIRNINRLRIVNEEKSRIDSELRAAANIQQGMLPKKFPPFPERDDIDVYGVLHPAKEIGGDLYDFYIRDEKLFFCIGDVSGKGMPASLMMAVTRSMFRIVSAQENNPQHIIEQMNNLVNEMNELSLFVTFFVGVLDLPTGKLRYCNAGHDAPLIMTKEVNKLNVLANLPVGVMSGILYMGQEIELDSETILFLYTDGLVEAKNRKREMFRERRMIDIAKEFITTDQTELKYLTDQMVTEVKKFTGNIPQFDDITMLAVKYKRIVHKEILCSSIVLKNDIQQLPILKTFIDDIIEKLKINRSLAMKLNLALEEAVVNVMEYAYMPKTEGEIEVSAHVDETQIKFIITDYGMAFDPTLKNEVDTTLTVEDRPIGGLGIHLVRQYMDSINYERADNKNILTLIKHI